MRLFNPNCWPDLRIITDSLHYARPLAAALAPALAGANVRLTCGGSGATVAMFRRHRDRPGVPCRPLLTQFPPNANGLEGRSEHQFQGPIFSDLSQIMTYYSTMTDSQTRVVEIVGRPVPRTRDKKNRWLPDAAFG